MKLLVIEDEPKTQHQIIQFLMEYNDSWIIEDECDNIEEAIYLLKTKSKYDLVLADIELTDGNLMNVLDQFPLTVPIIFITAYNQYMQRAFEVNSISYLTKPIKKIELFKALDKFQKISKDVTSNDLKDLLVYIKQQKEYKQKFLAQLSNKLVIVDIKDIAFFEIEDGVIFINTLKDRLMLKERSLDDIEEVLDPNSFMRVNRSSIVNKEHIIEIKPYDKNSIMINTSNKWIKSSQKKTVEFRKWITQ
ncbi:LytR/AlgR family response regulator transcription factor [Aureibacter tunicatorum]|uniref:DNA-binding LytR/AlgR family response regulator n=1 Tax=Aureibacter tunicatorum TaxID=866807 RepID=A0AAE4BS75_9BACT|nr:LytTR family DNA-binding domain-containing protein [Aureibacter tunicatorum]MDR6238585.1 DNA-binding LytR/AlgR family response regulator [Aureibacter tunicatorum]BDD05484.1 DNA-binding response regulator [Aureibacter tunicatorum]